MTKTARAGRRPDLVLPRFDVVLPLTRRAQVAETLREAILTGQLAQGSQLVELKLAERFGVSRGSIREAIWELIDQGLAMNKPYAGTFVIEIDLATMRELFALRGALEKFCFAEIWPRRDAAFRTEFITRHSALIEATASRNRNVVVKAEMRFHSHPYEFSGNGILLDVWRQLAKKIQLGFALSQELLQGDEFISDSARYLATALGEDLDAMHGEIDRHLRLGISFIEKLHEAQGAG